MFEYSFIVVIRVGFVFLKGKVFGMLDYCELCFWVWFDVVYDDLYVGNVGKVLEVWFLVIGL